MSRQPSRPESPPSPSEPSAAEVGDADRSRAAMGVAVQRVTIAFQPGQPILRELSMTVAAGEIVALVGASGCGKSTLLRAIAGLLPLSTGAIAMDAAGAPRPGALAYVFQDATLLPWRTVAENVALPFELAAAGMVGAVDRDARIREALDSVGLTASDAGKFPRELSGGMRMRTSIARALVTDPDVLLLDEPFAALDDLLRGRLNDLLLELWQRRRRTIVFVTHNIAEAVYLSHRVAVMGEGRVARWIDNSLGWPRSPAQRSSAPFATLYSRVSEELAAT